MPKSALMLKKRRFVKGTDLQDAEKLVSEIGRDFSPGITDAETMRALEDAEKLVSEIGRDFSPGITDAEPMRALAPGTRCSPLSAQDPPFSPPSQRPHASCARPPPSATIIPYAAEDHDLHHPGPFRHRAILAGSARRLRRLRLRPGWARPSHRISRRRRHSRTDRARARKPRRRA